jgi:heme/copper-type cytochrome/quinol oxidase subunit 4
MSTNTSGNKDKASQLAKASVVCGLIGVGCSLVLPVLAIYIVLEAGGYEPHDLFIKILLGIIVILCLLAIVFGVVSLRRNPTPVSRRIAIFGLLLGVTPPILVGLLFIVNH